MHLVFFDLETGGLDWTKHPITQIAAVAVDDELNEIYPFERKIIFDIESADPEALKMNGYDAGIWQEQAIDSRQAAREFSLFLGRYADIERTGKNSGNPYRVAQLAGHNSAFDFAFIKELFRLKSMFLPASYRVMDTLQRAAWHFHELPQDTYYKRPIDLKLGTLAEYFSIPVDKAHDALCDVRTTIAVYRKILENS